MTDQISLNEIIPEELGGKRLDLVAAELFSEYSRSRLKHWIEKGELTVDDATKRPKDKVFSGSTLKLDAKYEVHTLFKPQKIPLNIVFEDKHIIVINKPAGLVVHPAIGNYEGTLLNGLLYHCPQLETLPRGGIVHRLDKDTTGLMVVAKTLTAHTSLVEQLQARTVKRHYAAVVTGILIAGGTINEPIGRHPKNRLKMAVVSNGKHAVTHYRIKRRYRAHTYIKVNLETGRTHQIRVHMSHLNYPLVGDATYGARKTLPKGSGEKLACTLSGFNRQALHAQKLGLLHPKSSQFVEFESPLPDDFQQLINTLDSDI